MTKADQPRIPAPTSIPQAIQISGQDDVIQLRYPTDINRNEAQTGRKERYNTVVSPAACASPWNRKTP
jgi:hypothetical protein